MSTGNLLSGNVSNIRPPFKKQPSNYGSGYPHNMAVIVAPTKIDYSVTKGGLKTWAVLVTFIILCFTMGAIISEVEDDDYDNRDVNSFMAAINENEEMDNIVSGPSVIAEDVVVEQVPTSMDDEEENKDINLEIQLFKNLQKKIEKNKKYRYDKVKENVIQFNENDKNIEIDKKNYVKSNKQERYTEQHNKNIVNNDDEDSINFNKNERKKKKKIFDDKEDEKEDDQLNKKIEDNNHKENNMDNLETDLKFNSEIPKKYKQLVCKEVEEETENIENEDKDIDEDNEEDVIRKIKNKGPTRNKATLLRKKKLLEIYYEKRPRKSLLKKNRHLNKFYTKNNIYNEDDDDDDDDEFINDKSDEDNLINKKKLEHKKSYEISSIKKSKYIGSLKKLYTNKKDQKFRSKLDAGDLFIEKHDFVNGEAMYNEVLKLYPESPRAHYGRGRLYEIRSEFENSNNLMDQAMLEYQIILDNDEATDAMYKEASESLIRCARFRGNLHKVLNVQRNMIDRDPQNLNLQNEFGITFLMMGRHEDAKKIFLNVINENSNNSKALAYYGYILKVFDKDIVNGVFHMKKSILNGDLEHNDSKFFYHLGDGLMRLGRRQEAYKIYEKGAELGLFLSTYQRSIYNIVGLTAKPWWNVENSGCIKSLKSIEKQWVLIREEVFNVWKEHSDMFLPEEHHLTDGSQKYLPLLNYGKIIENNCLLTPKTCAILQKYIKNEKCFKDNSKISVLQSHTTVWPHCSTTNHKLIAHLCLLTSSEARIRVGNETKGWKNGKFIIFDESFEHELSYEGAAAGNNRIVLSIDLWHPEVPLEQRKLIIENSY
ncbi:Aspartyl/asparaginyl beta-hydroxylase [Strongyloides ratti]|uniref:Aspartyl/asparaginyl beta-hydroxylase n=1 Tax=Strongyloides ratti TaxID=34506 RepID=A0A090KZ35_STRRB|nr:Aspartyl/asparaginyl beta-hydroxylase [Strongyloides ratti]CEF61137.1 Aspartyl/asparaginyl beta-hydroxylase [Strongyloides ratti]